jgi:3-mercaptopyruvate sulfurtransferase SseA
MKNNIDDYCRKNRSRSISPSVSFDHPQNLLLTEEEKTEKSFYTVTVNEMIKEIFTSFDDLIRNVNHYLVKHIKNAVKANISDIQWDEVRFINRLIDLL